MTRQVFCRKYQKELEGLDFAPFPGAKGQELFDTVSKQAWEKANPTHCIDSQELYTNIH
jgi:Fe-S cluster biosynthesis and repair protein YggX